MYVPRDRDCFKLRSSVEKRVVVTLAQISDNLTTLKVQCTVHLALHLATAPPHLTTLPVHQVERCFGMLVSPGRNVRHSDMQLLEGVRCGEAVLGINILRFLNTRPPP